MHIYSVNDPEFKSYGNVWDNVPSELTSPVLEALSATPVPEGSKYVASAPELEGVKDADKLGFLMFGGRPFQLGSFGTKMGDYIVAYALPDDVK